MSDSGEVMGQPGPTVQTIGVVGCGVMGSGIAERCARQGFGTLVADSQPEQLARGLERIKGSLRRSVERQALSAAAAAAALERLQPVGGLDDLAACDLVIEAVTEESSVKTAVFAALDRLCKAETILASNTSSIPIGSLAAATRRGDRVLGMHFTNPVPRSKLLEIVTSLLTSDATLTVARSVAAALGLEVIVSRDRAGFILNFMATPFILDAIRMVQDGFASREDVDRAMTLGMGHPIGPLALADFVGLDVIKFIADVMYAELREPRYVPPPLLRQMVAAGWTGRKSGRGFYEYAADSRPS